MACISGLFSSVVITDTKSEKITTIFYSMSLDFFEQAGLSV
jgi:hypothetical protein